MGLCQLQRSLAARHPELTPQFTKPRDPRRATQGPWCFRREVAWDRKHLVLEPVHARAITGHSLKLWPVGDAAATGDKIIEPRGHAGTTKCRLPPGVEYPREDVEGHEGDEDPIRDHMQRSLRNSGCG